ncbi:MAG: 3-oxoacyl-[acyl-carrier-protein] reductase FabG [Verrucomicrobiae bacterium]|nr:3-oxoacyl-[acyl-carrier-protein] reductase FabG [Verrucomicrobiae bacterium]
MKRTAIVTGASRGIGLAIAQALAKAGIRTALLSRTKPAVPGKFIRCDLNDSAAIPAAVAAALRHLGGCDYLINNAGVFLEKPVAEMTLEDWERIQRVNVTGMFLVTREVLPVMLKRRQGRILNIASTASQQGYLHQAAYVASKHAMLGFARALAIEVKPHNIHVHNLCPGGVDTDLVKGTFLGKRMAGQPMIAPADIAAMVVFLLNQPDNIDLPELVVRRFV